MLLDSSMYIAYYCAICGKWEKIGVSLFSLKKGIEFVVEGICSDKFITVKTYDFKKFYFSVPCISCNTRHIYKYTLNNMIKNRPESYKCKLSKLDILLIGDEEFVEDTINQYEKNLKNMMSKCEFDEYIENPYIMMKALNRIHEIAEEGNLFCDCGGEEIDVNLFSDRIELRCMKCNSHNAIYTETNDDLKTILNKDTIVLHEKSFTCLDSMFCSERV